MSTEEDAYGSYARQLTKYFLAEGVVSGHALFLASAEPEPKSILKVAFSLLSGVFTSVLFSTYCHYLPISQAIFSEIWT